MTVRQRPPGGGQPVRPDCSAKGPGLWAAFRLRHRRRYLILRGWRRSRFQLQALQDNTAAIRPGDILLFATLRNEATRLPWFLHHYRRLGVQHFLFTDNASTDATCALLAGQADVSLWHTAKSYKSSRFGMDWMNGLLRRYGSGHWCVTADADELLIYPHWETRPLQALTEKLDADGCPALGTMMLDLYPEGPLGAVDCPPGTDPLRVLTQFDAGNYVMRRQKMLGNLWIQGGPRARAFFARQPQRAPTLGKVPLVRWQRHYAYVSSTHSLLPRALNLRAATDGGVALSGILLHTKFLSTIVEKSREEKERREHFANSSLYDSYYDAVIDAPVLSCPASATFTGWRQLEALGLMSRGNWV